MHRSHLLLISGAIIALFACAPRSGADLVLHNGTVITLDRYLPPSQAVAIVEGKILAVGFNDEILELSNWRTRKVNLHGAIVVPGLQDGHMHLSGFGQALEQVNLVGTGSPEEVIRLAKKQARSLPKGDWLLGRGWDQNDWDVPEFPNHAELSKAIPNHPVMLRRVDGHAIWVNQAALSLAGIDAGTPDPDGGAIYRDDHGRPTGILVDNAMDLVKNMVPKPSPKQIRRRLKAAIKACNAAGLTGVHDAGVDAATIAVIRKMVDDGKFSIRYYGMLNGDEPALLDSFYAVGPMLDYGDRATVRATKFYADGALGSRGAALLAPYSDDPQNSGLLVTPPEELQGLVRDALNAGFQPAVHAIGDRANRMVLDIYAALLPGFAQQDIRPRIEHAQVLSPRDIARFGELDVIAAMQPSHATSDMYWAEDRLEAERVKGAYAWRALLESGARLSGGTDCPVEKIDPLLQIYAARFRRDVEGWPEEGWFTGQRLGGLESLRMVTLWVAYAGFSENRRGKVFPGYDADLTVLSDNPLIGNPEQVLATKVVMTIVGGQVVYEDRRELRRLRKRGPGR